MQDAEASASPPEDTAIASGNTNVLHSITAAHSSVVGRGTCQDYRLPNAVVMFAVVVAVFAVASELQVKG